MTNPFSRRQQQPAYAPAPTLSAPAGFGKDAAGGLIAPVQPALPPTPTVPDIEELDLPPIPQAAPLTTPPTLGAESPASLSPSAPEMPDMTSDAVKARGLAARQAIARRAGRASTFLTSPNDVRSQTRSGVRPTLAG